MVGGCPLWRIASLLAALLVSGCAAGSLGPARHLHLHGDAGRAAEALPEEGQVAEKDRLLLLMEKGLILHEAGRYRESTEALLRAADLVEAQEVVSLSEQTVSLVTSERIVEYKGEFSERLWLHTYLMMNFLLLGDFEGALVEGKRALKVINRHSEPLAGDHVTRALIALCFECLGEINDAYIVYKNMLKTMADPSPILPEFYRLGRRLGFGDEVGPYRERIPPSLRPLLERESPAELVLLVGTGQVAVKVGGNIVLPPSIRFSFPRYRARTGRGGAEVRVAGRKPLPAFLSVETQLDAVARASLRARAAEIVAKETARVAAKEAIARAVGRETNTGVEIVLRALLFISEAPDTRGWETLPSAWNLVRIPLEPGVHRLRVEVSGPGLEGSAALPEFEAFPGGREFFSLRFNR